MNWQKIIWSLLLLQASCALASPTRRPLPPGIAADDDNFFVMRDDKLDRKFYLVPKRLFPTESSVQPFGKQTESCQAVDLYQKGQKQLIEAKLKLLKSVGTAENVQLLQAEIEGIEQSLAVFESKVVRVAATVRVRMELPDLAKARPHFGFRDTDTVVFPDIAALSLSPTTLDHLEFSEAMKRKSNIGVFEAEWNHKPFALSRGQFGSDVLPLHAELRPFPTELGVTQLVSLYTYCALKADAAAAAGKLLLPIAVSYALAVVEDEKVPAPSEWVLYNRQLGLKAWNLVQSLPSAQASAARVRVDTGEPRLYPKAGIFRPLQLSLIIDNKVSKKQSFEGVK